MSIISVLFAVAAMTMTPDASIDWFSIAGISLDILPGMSVDIPVPGLNSLIVGVIGVSLMAVGLALVYADSRVALEEIRKRNAQYKLLLARIHPLLWRDVLNTQQHSFIGTLPMRFAQIVFAFYLAKTIAGLTIWLVGMVVDGVGMFVPAVTAMLPVPLSSIYRFVTNIMGWGFDEQGMLLCIYAGLVLLATLFSRYERAFYQDYAVMQHQLLRKQK
jgi:hypothetical protein